MTKTKIPNQLKIHHFYFYNDGKRVNRFEHLNFGFVSNFGFRYSDFKYRCGRLGPHLSLFNSAVVVS
jgi:hypothetical protein